MITDYRKRKKRKPGLHVVFPITYTSLLLLGLLVKYLTT
jgi:hypothetical protein